MPRAAAPRHVTTSVKARIFCPTGACLHTTESVTLDLDALEALRLADLVGLYHEAAAARMGVSRATFGRLVAEARRRVAEALVLGKVLRIAGGEVVQTEVGPIPCPVHRDGRRQGRECLCQGRAGAANRGGRQ
ncbi:MAG: DUF134 domain-containing protein [Thermoanaerobaculaceae bacterium]|nr:DUF134 domain-containing protein [Thermoanaerobaculaceae bacterium]MDI9623220.1 DUF134 domain-containing protein [Acidobacteriota bacterium]NLH10301.1 DUF134 domain-containing protein [Holophagae bacterium]HPW56088.1 DUF134 domain-containing protein [Thermoanaerobaculaceae bacterium]